MKGQKVYYIYHWGFPWMKSNLLNKKKYFENSFVVLKNYVII